MTADAAPAHHPPFGQQDMLHVHSQSPGSKASCGMNFTDSIPSIRSYLSHDGCFTIGHHSGNVTFSRIERFLMYKLIEIINFSIFLFILFQLFSNFSNFSFKKEEAWQKVVQSLLP